jgi:hypothetical protein
VQRLSRKAISRIAAHHLRSNGVIVMNERRLDRIARQLISGGTRRGLLRLSASLPLASSLGLWLGRGDAVATKKHNRRHKKKHRKKCGKAGAKPVKGKCCTGTVSVDRVCQTCDVCASGCAFSSVQAAIDAAALGATIAVCPGVYREDLKINGLLTVVGAGDGDDESVDTIVQGTGQKAVVTIASGTVAIAHLRITGGVGIPDDLIYGGGIYNLGTTELIGCTVSENTAYYGGGIYNEFESALTLTACTVRQNTAGIDGGGIFNQSTVTADAASRVTANAAGAFGGGIYSYGGTVTLASNEIVTANNPDNCAGDAVPNCSG